MSWMPSFEGEKADVGKAFSAPLGAASPLWWAFAGAATAGAAYWLMMRWARPVNLEAAAGAPSLAKPVLSETSELEAETAEETALEEALEEAAATYELAPEAIEDVTETPLAKDPLKEMETELEAAADDLTLLIGIGPKLALALADRGVTRFAQIAAWTEEDLAEVDGALNLRGRAHRDQWVDQAKKLAEGPIPFLPE